ncbi:hypothetical protein SEVIR_4G207132v4 [Setaria viridis]
MARTQPRFDLGFEISGSGMCKHTYTHTHTGERERSGVEWGGWMAAAAARRRTRRRKQRAYQDDQNQALEKNPSMAAQIPRCPTTPPDQDPPQTPPPQSPTPTHPPPQHRRPPKGLQSGTKRRGGERGGPGGAWIRGGPPVGSRAGANRGALPHRRRFLLEGRGFR